MGNEEHNTIADYKILSEKFIDTLCSIHQNFFRQTTIPIPGNNFMTLVILENEGPSTIRTLGTLLRMSKQQMTPIINKLSKDGYIIKSTSLEDRRFTTISLTDKGRGILDEHTESIRRRFEKAAACLTAGEVASFTASLDTFVTSIERMNHPMIEKCP